MTTVIRTTTSDQWLRDRNRGVGASEVPVLFGAVKYMSVLELWARKRGEHTKPIEESEPMLLGKIFEVPILAEVARRAGVDVVHNRDLYVHGTLPLVATPDGIIRDESGRIIAGAEVKNIGYSFEDDWDNELPLKYRLQCQAGMLALGVSRYLFGACISGQRIVWEWVEWDELLAQEIADKVARFWQQVQGNDMPDSDGSDSARSILAARATADASVELSCHDLFAEWATLRDEYSEASKIAEFAASKRRAIEDRIARELGTNMRGVTTHGWSAEWRVSRRKGFTVEPSETKALKISPPKKARKSA